MEPESGVPPAAKSFIDNVDCFRGVDRHKSAILNRYQPNGPLAFSQVPRLYAFSCVTKQHSLGRNRAYC